MKFYKMDHRGGLDEGLNTRVEISFDNFSCLLPLYNFYAFDKRINCVRYILKDMEKNYKEYTIWLLIEV